MKQRWMAASPPICLDGHLAPILGIMSTDAGVLIRPIEFDIIDDRLSGPAIDVVVFPIEALRGPRIAPMGFDLSLAESSLADIATYFSLCGDSLGRAGFAPGVIGLPGGQLPEWRASVNRGLGFMGRCADKVVVRSRIVFEAVYSADAPEHTAAPPGRPDCTCPTLLAGHHAGCPWLSDAG